MSPRKHSTPSVSRSTLGLFDTVEEPGVYRSLVEDLRGRGAMELKRLQERYADAVDEPERRKAVERLLERIASSSPGEAATSLPVLVDFLYFAADQLTLAKHRLIFPAYNLLDEYDANKTGPWGPLATRRPTTSRRWSVLDHAVDFPIGIAACPLTANSRWIAFWASMGYNVITYKSVRDRETHAHTKKPHWVLLPSVREPFVPGHEPEDVRAEPDDWCLPGDPNISSANSFGIPSDDPTIWQEDVQLALQAMYPDQLLIVSVLGDLYKHDAHTRENLARNFVKVALQAYEAGARVIELNLSCPNLLDESGVQPPLCTNTALTAYVVRHVREHLPDDAKLVAKLSYLEPGTLRKLLEEIGGILRGVSAINTLQLPVLRRDASDPSLASDTFPDRREAGVSGVAIRSHALTFAAELQRLRTELGLKLDIIGMGGVTSAESFAALKAVGVDAVQAVTGAFANPLLAADIIEKFKPDLERFGPIPNSDASKTSNADADADAQELTRQRVIGVLAKLGQATSFDIAAVVGVRVGRTIEALEDLSMSGEVETVARRGDMYYRLSSNA